MNSTNFFTELRKRNVYKVAIAYAVIAWLCVEAGLLLFQLLEADESLITGLIVLVVIGFPIALYIAWSFEMTPHGMKRTENVLPDEHIPQWSRKKFLTLMTSAFLLAALLALYQIWRTHHG